MMGIQSTGVRFTGLYDMLRKDWQTFSAEKKTMLQSTLNERVFQLTGAHRARHGEWTATQGRWGNGYFFINGQDGAHHDAVQQAFKALLAQRGLGLPPNKLRTPEQDAILNEVGETYMNEQSDMDHKIDLLY